ncbi:histidine kinase [Sphingobacterium sp. E70]|nr:sensor histidine kinase [Sphingobacterium sp. E70]ULT23745.1 histidine kinase [Sphingobacterium sp. E70]
MKPFVFKAIFFVLILALLISVVDVYFIMHSQVLSEDERNTLLFVQCYKSIPSSLLINGTACGIRFYQEHANIQQDHSQLQQNFLESQLKILQDQVNPHFMFNVLNHIHILMKKNVDMADFLLLKFSDILRYQLYECNQSFVLLSRELQYLQNFITIEQMRWGDELEVDCNWSQSTEDLHIAPLMLICFVENAFKHVDRLPNQKAKSASTALRKTAISNFISKIAIRPIPCRHQQDTLVLAWKMSKRGWNCSMKISTA